MIGDDAASGPAVITVAIFVSGRILILAARGKTASAERGKNQNTPLW